MTKKDTFRFYDPGILKDGDLELILRNTTAADPLREWAPSYEFDMHAAGHLHRVGRISLRVGNTEHIIMYAGHIGYGVEPEHQGRRYAGRACRLVFPLALRHGIDPLWITCNPENTASRRTCEYAGGALIETVPVPEDNVIYKNGDHFKCRYRFDLEKVR